MAWEQKYDAHVNQFLVIIHNTDGRPCGWGLSTDESAARKEAERQYGSHTCYGGEKRGKTVIHMLPRKA